LLVLLQVFHTRASMAPLAIFGVSVMLIAANSAQLHLIDAVYAKQRKVPEVTYGRAYSRLGARTAIQPHDVVKDDIMIGRDPDPFIREEMLRHYGVGGPQWTGTIRHLRWSLVDGRTEIPDCLDSAPLTPARQIGESHCRSFRA
jgi:hypothetical protein